MGRVIKKLEIFLFGLVIFLIPSNLWFGLERDQAGVYGIIVDYLIPKVYGSDLLILIILALWLIRDFWNLRDQAIKLILHTHLVKLMLFIGLVVSLLVSSALADKPMPAWWQLAKWLQLTMLTLWGVANLQSLKQITKPLLLTLIFQSAIGIVQWVQKSSLLGYFFLGESTLNTHSSIAKTGIFGEIRPLPYGTTAHPNILAGFIVISLLILLVSRLWQPPTHKPSFWHSFRSTLVSLITLVLSLTTLALTQSFTAITAFVASLLLLVGQKARLKNLVAIFVIVVSLIVLGQPLLEQESWQRRSQLAKISLDMTLANPWFGVGLTNFTWEMSQFGFVAGNIRFLQPVHNIYLLFWAETGTLTVFLLLAFLLMSGKQIVSYLNNHFLLSLPLLVLLVIGLNDHYPFSLQTGQLLTSLSLIVALGRWQISFKAKQGHKPTT